MSRKIGLLIPIIFLAILLVGWSTKGYSGKRLPVDELGRIDAISNQWRLKLVKKFTTKNHFL